MISGLPCVFPSSSYLNSIEFSVRISFGCSLVSAEDDHRVGAEKFGSTLRASSRQHANLRESKCGDVV
jgi:hypothetical protein